jgi:hypothetical protein
VTGVIHNQRSSACMYCIRSLKLNTISRDVIKQQAITKVIAINKFHCVKRSVADLTDSFRIVRSTSVISIANVTSTYYTTKAFLDSLLVYSDVSFVPLDNVAEMTSNLLSCMILMYLYCRHISTYSFLPQYRPYVDH